MGAEGEAKLVPNDTHLIARAGQRALSGHGPKP